jgi:hypothetical protein
MAPARSPCRSSSSRARASAAHASRLSVGARWSPPATASPNVARSSPAIRSASSAWMAKIPAMVRSRSNVSAHRWSSVRASMSWAFMRIRPPACWTPPSSTYATPSSRPISGMDRLRPAYRSTEVREITVSPGTRASWVRRSSCSPEAKKSADPSSALRLANGRTAIPLARSSADSAAAGAGRAGSPEPVRMSPAATTPQRPNAARPPRRALRQVRSRRTPPGVVPAGGGAGAAASSP